MSRSKIYNIIAKNIKYYREKANYTTEELGKLSGYESEFIEKIEDTDRKKGFNPAFVDDIATALKIPVGLLFKEENEDK